MPKDRQPGVPSGIHTSGRNRRAVVALGCLVLLATGWTGAAAPADALAGATAAAAPVAAAAPSRAETVAARRLMFGAGNVDAGGAVRGDRVIVSWYGVSSLALAWRGTVVLLDTYVNDDAPCAVGTPPPSDPYVPLDVERLVALRPAYLFIGHGHEDHSCRTGELAARTGAVVVGLTEHCAAARAELAGTAWAGIPVRCVEAVPQASAPGDSRRSDLPGLRGSVTAIRHVHSGPAILAPSQDGGNASVMYRFEGAGFSLVWHDTAGPLREHAPRVLDTLRNLPPTDVELGAILGIGVVQQGLRDPVDYMSALRARTFYPLHHDLFRGLFPSAWLRGPLETEMAARAGLPTTLVWLQDPADYVRPLLLHRF